MDYLGEPDVTTRALISQEGQSQRRRCKEAGSERERSEDAIPLALKMEDAP